MSLSSFFNSANGETDTGTMLGVSLIATYIGLSIYSVLHAPDGHFDGMAFATGAAALLGAVSAHGFFYNRENGDKPPAGQ